MYGKLICIILSQFFHFSLTGPKKKKKILSVVTHMIEFSTRHTAFISVQAVAALFVSWKM